MVYGYLCGACIKVDLFPNTLWKGGPFKKGAAEIAMYCTHLDHKVWVLKTFFTLFFLRYDSFFLIFSIFKVTTVNIF